MRTPKGEGAIFHRIVGLVFIRWGVYTAGWAGTLLVFSGLGFILTTLPEKFYAEKLGMDLPLMLENLQTFAAAFRLVVRPVARLLLFFVIIPAALSGILDVISDLARETGMSRMVVGISIAVLVAFALPDERVGRGSASI